MATTIEFDYKGRKYTLGFTKKTVVQLERQGFVIGDIENRPMTILPQFFAGSFLAYNHNVKKEVIEEIFSKMTNKDQLFETLITMYKEPLEALVEEPEDSEGNISWATNS